MYYHQTSLNKNKNIKEIPLNTNENIKEIPLNTNENTKEISLNTNENTKEISLNTNDNTKEFPLNTNDNTKESSLNTNDNIKESSLNTNDNTKESSLNTNDNIKEIPLNTNENSKESPLNKNDNNKESSLNRNNSKLRCKYYIIIPYENNSNIIKYSCRLYSLIIFNPKNNLNEIKEYSISKFKFENNVITYTNPFVNIDNSIGKILSLNDFNKELNIFIKINNKLTANNKKYYDYISDIHSYYYNIPGIYFKKYINDYCDLNKHLNLGYIIYENKGNSLEQIINNNNKIIIYNNKNNFINFIEKIKFLADLYIFHNDINISNITLKDNNFYLIDLGSFIIEEDIYKNYYNYQSVINVLIYKNYNYKYKNIFNLLLDQFRIFNYNLRNFNETLYNMYVFYDCLKLLEIILDCYYNNDENIFINYLFKSIKYVNINFNHDYLLYFLKNN